jgi:hypothetical protein
MNFETWFKQAFPGSRIWFTNREYENLKTAYTAGLQISAAVCDDVDRDGSGEGTAYRCAEEIRALCQYPPKQRFKR